MHVNHWTIHKYYEFFERLNYLLANREPIGEIEMKMVALFVQPAYEISDIGWQAYHFLVADS